MTTHIKPMLASLLLAASACSSYQVMSAPTPATNRATRIESYGQPLNVALRSSEAQSTFQYCSAVLVQGPVLSVIADTVIFAELTRVDPVQAFDRRCRSVGAARVVVAPGTATFSEERADTRRTIGAGLVIGLMVAMLLGGI